MSAGDESQTLEIDDVILHPMYDLSQAYQDIAVIRLKPNKGKYLSYEYLKVHIFWEGHKILQNLHQLIDWQYIGQMIGGDFAKYWGLLRIYEL